MPRFGGDDSTGLLGHYVGTVEESFAGTNAQYQEGNVVRLTWETSVDDVLQEDYDGEIPPSITRNITLGDGWDVNDDGILFHEDDEARVEKGLAPRDFKTSSFYGSLLAIIAGEKDDYSGRYEVADGGDDELDLDLSGVKKYFEDTYGSLDKVDSGDPKIWLGFTFEFRTVHYEMRGNPDGFNRTLPVRVVSTPAGAKKATRKKGAKSEPVNFPWEEYGASGEVAAQLASLLNTARTESEFVQKALNVPGVSDNETLMAVLVSDEGPWSYR
jgi:hypothetical protein